MNGGKYLTEQGQRAALVAALVLFTLASLTYHFWPTTSDAATKVRHDCHGPVVRYYQQGQLVDTEVIGSQACEMLP